MSKNLVLWEKFLHPASVLLLLPSVIPPFDYDVQLFFIAPLRFHNTITLFTGVIVIIVVPCIRALLYGLTLSLIL